MALSYSTLTGFEVGSAPGQTLTGAGVTFDTTTPRSGLYRAHIVSPLNTATCISFGTIGGKNAFRFAVKVSSRPSSGVAGIAGSTHAGAEAFTLQISSAGVLQLGAAATAYQIGPTIDTTNYHLVEFQVDSTNLTVDWKIDGVLQTRATMIASASGDLYNLGTPFATQPAFTADYDDVILGSWTVAATDWWGDGKILAQLPGSDGTHNTVADFSPGDAGTIYSGTVTTAWTMVDDPAGTGGWTATRSTTDNLAMRVVNTTAYLEIAPAPTSQPGKANAVQAYMTYSSATTVANAAGCVVRNSAGAVSELWGIVGGVLQPYNVTTNTFQTANVTKPAAGWTAAEVNAIRFRFGGGTSSDISPVPTVQAMMLEVDWPVAAAAALLAGQHHRRPQAVYARRDPGGSRARF